MVLSSIPSIDTWQTDPSCCFTCWRRNRLEQAAVKDGTISLSGDDLGLICLDLFMFAGVVGSTHLVNGVVRDLAVDASRPQLFEKNPMNFVLEVQQPSNGTPLYSFRCWSFTLRSLQVVAYAVRQ